MFTYVRHHTFQPYGYPEELPEVPPDLPFDFNLCARVIALADYYDASHRNDSAGYLTREEIRTKVLANNPDVADLVNELYDFGIFSTKTA